MYILYTYDLIFKEVFLLIFWNSVSSQLMLFKNVIIKN